MRKFFLIHAAVATIAFANASATGGSEFSVIHSPNFDIRTNALNTKLSYKMGVRLEGSEHVYTLNNSNTKDSLLYSGEIPSNNKPYQYVVLDERNKVIDTEPFYRPSRSNGGPPIHEFFKRKNTINRAVAHELTMNRVDFRYKDAEDDYKYKEGLDRSNVHPVDEIPTFHIQANSADFRTLHDRVLEDIGINANITRISSNNVDFFDNVKIELSGQTSRLFRKLSYSVHIGKETANSLNGYRRFKLRSCATDPTYMREKLYYDVLSASDVPTAKASYIRLFVNEEPLGLYLIADNYKNPFLSNTFSDNRKKYKQGTLYQGSMQENPLAIGRLQYGANLAYLGPKVEDYVEPKLNTTVYKIQELGHGVQAKDGLKQLLDFVKFIHKTETTGHHKKKDNKGLIHDWNKKFDVSLFLKHMVFEIIMGHNDGYMGAAHNYMLYQDPDQKGRFVWLASDLDQTLGSTLIARRSNKPKSALEQLDRFALLDNISARPLVNQILQVKSFHKQFYQIFADIHRSLFKSNSISSHIGYLRELIEQDVAWDKQLEKFRPDNFKSNQDVFNNQLNQKVLQLPLGHDFYDRINKIDFDTAIDGPIEDHPSLTSLADWFVETGEFLNEFINSASFKSNKN